MDDNKPDYEINVDSNPIKQMFKEMTDIELASHREVLWKDLMLIKLKIMILEREMSLRSH